MVDRVKSLGVLACMLASSAHADVIRVLASDDRIAIALPGGAPVTGSTLQIELDGYDIAAVSVVANGQLAIPLRSLGLAPGEHYLLVLAATADGEVETLAEHTLDVYQQPGRRTAAQDFNLLLSDQYRFAQDPDESFEGAPRNAGTAALQWSGKFDSGTWSADGAVNVLYDNQPLLTPEQKRWQLPAVRLAAGRRIGSGSIALAFGDGDVGLSNLIFSGFDRRGLRLEAAAFEQRFVAQAFTLHPQPVTGFEADVPPFDSGASVVGATALLAAFPRHPDALRLSAGWLDGSGTLGGAGISAAAVDPESALSFGGHASTLAIDSFALDRSLWLHGEYAASRFDADGLAAGNGARDDHATRFVAQISSGGQLRLPVLDLWTLGYQQQRVGTNFYSLGNLLLPGDLAQSQTYASLATRGVSLDLRLLVQNTDVADDAFRPRIDSRQQYLTAGYTPPGLDPAAAPWKWLGVPTLSLSYQYTANEQRAADMLLAGYDLDNRQRSLSAGVGFEQERISVNLNLDQVRRNDLSLALIVDDFVLYAPPADSRETLLGVNITWRPNERLTFSPQWQRSRLRETPQGARSSNDLWSLQLQASLIPEVLSLQMGWSDTQDRQTAFELPQDAQRLRSSTGNFDLGYRLRNPDAIWPGVNLNLRAAYGRNALHSALAPQTERQWQALLSFELNWKQERQP